MMLSFKWSNYFNERYVLWVGHAAQVQDVRSVSEILIGIPEGVRPLEMLGRS